MPNTPALVQAGAAVLAPGSAILKGDNDLVAELLSSVGICEEGTEANLDAVTGVSGSGPAYVSCCFLGLVLCNLHTVTIKRIVHLLNNVL